VMSSSVAGLLAVPALIQPEENRGYRESVTTPDVVIRPISQARR